MGTCILYISYVGRQGPVCMQWRNPGGRLEANARTFFGRSTLTANERNIQHTGAVNAGLARVYATAFIHVKIPH